MTNAEGVEALRRVLSAPRLAQVVVSPRDLVALLQQAAAAPGAARAGSGPAASRERHARPDTGREFVEPRSEVERTLATIWSEVLGIDRVGLDDDFFRLGGDSVLGIQVVARTGEAGIRIRPEQLFEHATLRELAAAVSGEAAEGSEEGIPLTRFQRRVLEGAAAPWLAAAVPLADAAVEDLEAALAAAVDRHQSLRLRFPEGAATRAAVLTEPGERPLPVRRLAFEGVDEEARERGLREAADTLARTLDPVRGPVLAAAWGEHEAGGGTFLLVAHRAVVDGPSMATLCREIAGPGAGSAPLGGGPLVELDETETAVLYGEVAETLRAEPREILVAGIARTVLPRIGAGALAVEVEWDGREPGQRSADGAVGCFLHSALVLLDPPGDAAESPVATVRRVKEAMRKGVEDALGGTGFAESEAAPAAADGLAGPLPSWVRATLLSDVGSARVWTGGDVPRGVPAVLAVQASVVAGRWRLEWPSVAGAPETAPAKDLAGELLAALRAVSDEARTAGGETWSPADFPEADLSEEALESVLSKLDS